MKKKTHIKIAELIQKKLQKLAKMKSLLGDKIINSDTYRKGRFLIQGLLIF